VVAWVALAACARDRPETTTAPEAVREAEVVAREPAPPPGELGSAITWRDHAHSAASFRHADRIFSTSTVRAPASPRLLHVAAEELAVTYEVGGVVYSLEDFVARTGSTGVLVLRGPEILFERYAQGAGPGSRLVSFSVAKSITVTLLAMVLGADFEAKLDDPIDRHLPQVRGSGYEGVPIRAILQMSSGLKFLEEYENAQSDIARLAAPMRDPTAGSFDDVAVTFPNEAPPGQKFHYVSNDTQILGMLARTLSGKSLTQLTEELLWQPLGAEGDAYWITDSTGVEMAFGGFNATLRDYGRFGLLYARDGVWEGQALLPAGWVEAATAPHGAHVELGKLYPEYPLGYGYQWWLLPDADRPFTAQGIHGQFVLVHRPLDLVMVKTSNWAEPWSSELEAETYTAFRAIVARLQAPAGA
jgi:CubicO group peptidase (beta-lactamase class C family)